MEDTQPSRPPEVSFLRESLEFVFSSKTHSVKLQKVVPVAVIAIQRYLAEQQNQQPIQNQTQTQSQLQSQNLQQTQQVDSYRYDVTLTDGVWRTKCFLHPSLNHLVHRNILRSGADVSITECSVVYSERRLGHAYMCIRAVDCCPGESGILTRTRDVASLPLLTANDSGTVSAWSGDAPLQLGRRHYLALWNNEDPEGDVWTSQGPISDVVLDVSNVTLLCDVDSSFGGRSRHLPLLVKVLHKSRLRYYGRFGLKIDFPYQAYFEVADQSGIASLVLWNELCPEWYRRLTVGTVLYIQNYSVKRSYSGRSRPHMDHHRLRAFGSVEICLNSWNPVSVITVVPPKQVQRQWVLPDVAYNFKTRSEVENLPHNFTCDVIGLVTFVGRVQRIKNKDSHGPEKYWSYRWVQAVDGTFSQPFILEIFSSSEPKVFNGICPMTYLVCTQMRICKVDGSLPYLTSSTETELFITGHHKGQPYVSNPKVKGFIQWTKTLKDRAVMRKTFVGGHFFFPHAPQVFTQSVLDGSAQVRLVSTEDLRMELESLQYREHRRLAIQGQITAVQYQRWPQGSAVAEQEQVPDLSAGATDEAVPNTEAVMAPSSETLSPRRVKRDRKKRMTRKSYYTRSKRSGEGQARRDHTERGPEEEEEEEEKEEEHLDSQEEDGGLLQGHGRPGWLAGPQVVSVRDKLSWESSAWPEQRRELSQLLCPGNSLHPESLSSRFTLDKANSLLYHSNLQPGCWTPEHCDVSRPPVDCPGYYRITILGVNKQMAVNAAFLPVVSSGDPRAAGLSQDPHGNTLLSCLAAGFLCPLSDPDSLSETTLPEPEEVLGTAKELEGVHLVCILDICQLAGNRVEVLINKVYRDTEVALV